VIPEVCVANLLSHVNSIASREPKASELSIETLYFIISSWSFLSWFQIDNIARINILR
jgi:hypothetical protein